MNAAPPAPYLDTPGLICDADHVYHLGQETPDGVTDTLGAVGLLTDPRHFAEGSAERGIFIHAMLAAAARGYTFDMELVDLEFRGWIQSGLDFLAAKLAEGAVILGVELRRFHPLYRFAGTIDLILLERGRVNVYDYKSGKAAKAVRFQLGAYGLLLPEADRPRKFALELDRDGGKAHPIGYNELEHWHDGNRFLGYLTTARDVRTFGPKERV